MASSTSSLGGLAAATPGASRGNGGAAAAPVAQAPMATQSGLTTPTSAGGANALNAPPDQSALAQDPTYLAYMRSLGLANANDQATAQQGIDAQNSALAVRIPLQQTADQFASQHAIGTLEARGILESGGAANQMGELANTQQARIAGYQTATADKVAAIRAKLQADELANTSKLAEAGLTAASTLGLAQGKTQVTNAVNNASAGTFAAPAAPASAPGGVAPAGG